MRYQQLFLTILMNNECDKVTVPRRLNIFFGDKHLKIQDAEK